MCECALFLTAASGKTHAASALEEALRVLQGATEFSLQKLDDPRDFEKALGRTVGRRL